MLLEDTAIKFKSQYKNLIVPFNENQLQPCSYDLTLDKDLLTFEFASNSCPPDAFITAYDKQVHGIDYQSIDLSILKDEIYVLQPNQFIIASTQETVNMPDDIAGRFEGKSSLGRLGLTTHVTAGFIDAGFSGQITLEMKNENRFPIWIKRGMKIGQICFFKMNGRARHPYGSEGLGSHYNNQNGPTPARS